MVDATAARAPHRPHLRAVVALVCVAGLLLAVGGYLMVRPSGPAARPVAAPSRAIPTATPTPSATPTTPVMPPTPAATPRPKPVARIPHDYVSPAGPTSFRFSGRAFTITAQVCGMPNIRPLDPPGEQHHTVCWVNEGFGVAPGSHTATTYVLGHAWGQDDLEVLNRASAPATREVLRSTAVTTREGVRIWPVRSLDGYLMTLRTPKGTLTYRVGHTFGVHKHDTGRLSSVMNEKVRNRIVLITCAELHHTDYDYNIVSFANLVASKRAAAASPA